MQTHLHTCTQTEHEDAKHFLSGSCQIPSVWKKLNLEPLMALGVMTQTPEILMTQMDNPILALTHTITLLSHATRHRPEDSGTAHTKVCKPDTFNGMDLKKLHEFLVQCELNFHDRSQAFHSDAWKVSFALSYPDGACRLSVMPSLGLQPA
ncbi:hypothetical protein ID866_12556 [Astraeus odoratus]|nr:hypothetical protein ID866_12556 [Astraeus odoratus]